LHPTGGHTARRGARRQCTQSRQRRPQLLPLASAVATLHQSHMRLYRCTSRLTRMWTTAVQHSGSGDTVTGAQAPVAY
jgi:hypothetical protein